MKRFKLNQRVRVVSGDANLIGKLGSVVRCRITDHGAWVAMDEPLPDGFRQFPPGDPSGRGNWMVLFPQDCEQAKP